MKFPSIIAYQAYTITSLTCTCTACPTQYEFMLDNGHMGYLRYRHGTLGIYLSPTPTTDIMQAVNGVTIIHKHLDAGYISDGILLESEVMLILSLFFNFKL